MKNLFQITAVTFALYANLASAANWIVTGATNEAVFYYDSETMVKNSGIVTVWKKMNVVEKNGQKYSWIFRDEIDCRQKLSRTISMVRYTDLDGKGNSLSTPKLDEKWDSNPPGSVGESALKEICKAAEKIPDQSSWSTKIKNVFK